MKRPSITLQITLFLYLKAEQLERYDHGDLKHTCMHHFALCGSINTTEHLMMLQK